MLTLLEKAVKMGASDVHLTVGSKPMMRFQGKLSPLADTIVTAADMESFAKTKDLATELFFLIPEIYCEVIINSVKYNDIIVIMKDNGEVESIHSTQMRVYNYIKEAIYTHLDREHPSDEKIFNVISLSARYLSISNALEKGEKELKDIDRDYLTIHVDKSYKLF